MGGDDELEAPSGQDAKDDTGADEDDEEEPQRRVPDEIQVQQKLAIFGCSSAQQSIKRLWEFVHRDPNGNLTMEGYVEINLRLQKCLTKVFGLEAAVDSALGDWSEDVREGQEVMNMDDFAMFFFELCSVWCGPRTSLRLYLLFLNGVFLAVTDAKGAHTSGLKALEEIQRLPEAFFELISLQGWAPRRPEEEKDLENEASKERFLGVWLTQNVSPESEESAVLHVQRQIFQVTHDIRAVFLFRESKGRGAGQADYDFLEALRMATKNLSKVKPEGRRPVGSTALATGLPRLPARPTNTEAIARLESHPVSSAARMRASSGPSRSDRPKVQISDPKLWPPKRGEVPRGRAFESQLAQGRGRGLALVACQVLKPSSTLPAIEDNSLDSLGPSIAEEAARPSSTPVYIASTETDWPPEIAELQGRFLDCLESSSPNRSAEVSLRSAMARGEATSLAEDSVQLRGVGTNLLEAASLLPTYQLPKKPRDVYQRQVDPLMMRPAAVVGQTNLYQDKHQLLGQPFERVLKKLSKDIRPADGCTPPGPMGHPNEPVWFAMQHRLEGILRKQERRADRKRKRRLRAKLLRGQPLSQSRVAGRDLRDYLDRAAAERSMGLQDPPGEMAGEFLGKVHEQYMQRKAQIETERFQVRNLGGSLGQSPIAAASSPRILPAVRPVYMPPPGAKHIVM